MPDSSAPAQQFHQRQGSAEVQVTKGVERTLQLPFISMLNIPMFEVSKLNIDFNVRLKGATQFEIDFSADNTTRTSVGANGGSDLASLGIPRR